MIKGEEKIKVNIEEELKTSFLDYAMSVIVGRALPDVRDGLKPVHRRILYAMYKMGLLSNKPYRKSARIVGEVMGNYHPHGDSPIYEALVRMAQPFSMRYPLVDGQGNFGSMDGDPPAAMRYTEARLTKLAQELLRDIDKDTVDFVPNYDESTTEPVVLPSVIPNLLINGSSGIAVGMATNIPPHNLKEVTDALLYLIDNPNCTLDDLLQFIKGPDFPTGGIIYGQEGIFKAYREGKGTILIRAKYHIEPPKKHGKHKIIITEIPYTVNKASVIEKIANLVTSKKLDEIADIRDESDRRGVRVVIEVKKGENPEIVINKIFKNTNLQFSYGIILLAIHKGRPKIFDLKSMLEAFIEHRKEIIFRRTKYELKKALDRAHILEGLKKALEYIDEIIAIIKSSKSPNIAKERLIATFEFSLRQAQAILEMRLQRLTALERDKLIQEYMELLKTIERLKSILESESVLMNIIKEEIIEIQNKYADERRTLIIPKREIINEEDLIREENVIVIITHSKYIKRMPLVSFKRQNRNTKGRRGIVVKSDDFVEHLFVTSTHEYLLVFTNSGKVYAIKVYKIPEGGPNFKGKPIIHLLNIDKKEKIKAIISVKDFNEDSDLIFATKKGIVKRTALNNYSSVASRNKGLIAIKIRQDDELIAVNKVKENEHIFLATKYGKSIRFPESDVRPLSRASLGIIGIKLKDGDEVIGMEILPPDSDNENCTILTVTENGYGKRTPTKFYRIQRRGGKGLINIKVTQRNGPVVGILRINENDEILMITLKGKILRQKINEKTFKVKGRATQGIKLQDVSKLGKVVAIAKVINLEDKTK